MSATGFLQSSAIGCCLVILNANYVDAAYRYEVIDYPGAIRTTISSVNNKGEVVGWFGGERGYSQSFLRSATGVFSELDPPGAAYTYVEKLSNDGRIVGNHFFGSGGPLTAAFVREADGNYTTLDFTPLLGHPFPQPPGDTASIRAINSNGVSVGVFSKLLSTSPLYEDWASFLHSSSPSPKGTFSVILDYVDAAPVDINDSGQIAGNIDEESGFVASHPGHREDLIVIQYPGAKTTRLTGMNNNGDVVGRFQTPEGGGGFFLRTAQGEFRELPPPLGATLQVSHFDGPTDLNDAGQIVGTYSDPPTIPGSLGVQHGYIATLVVPEPRLNLLLSVGLTVLAVLSRRRRNQTGQSYRTITGLDQREHARAFAAGDSDVLASAGGPRTGVEVRIVDAEARAVPDGEIGEIVTRSDCVMAGYWMDPAASAAALRGWLHTGDLGSRDARGFVTLKDRSKDMIISGGSNIYPREIEEVLLRHPAVAQASVVGATHPEWGEEVVAFVVPAPNAALREEDLDALCLENIARYKRPRRYVFVEDLPKNNYGKVLKTALRAELARKG